MGQVPGKTSRGGCSSSPPTRPAPWRRGAGDRWRHEGRCTTSVELTLTDRGQRYQRLRSASFAETPV